MRVTTWLRLSPMLSLLLCACGANTTSDAAGSGNSMLPGAAAPDGHQAAQASFESGDNASANDPGTAAGTQTTSHSLRRAPLGGVSPVMSLFEELHEARALQTKDGITASFASQFEVQGCKAVFDVEVTTTLGDSAGITLDGNVVFDPNACVRSRRLSGTASVTGTLTGLTRHLEVAEDVTQTLVNGDQVFVTSGTAQRPTYILDANGFAAGGNVMLSVRVDEHRRRLASTGNVVFDLNITTDATSPLQIINGYAENANAAATMAQAHTRTIVAGTNTVVHNVAHYTAKHTFDHLAHTLADCNCPDSGSLTESVTYQDMALGGFTRVYTFTGCGVASVNTQASTDPNVIVGTSEVTWDSCH